MKAAAPLMVLLALTACGPPDPMREIERAYEECAERARAAAGPTGTFGIGIGTGGVSTGLEIGVTTDYLAGRDPDEVYQACFLRRTGTPPARPWR